MYYHKIKTIYKRNPATKHKTLLEGEYATPEFEYLADNQWVWTEKVDGTNIQVMWDGEKVTLGGKTERAQIPPFLVNVLQDMFPAERLADVLDGPVTLCGEGYGARIQKGGGNYIPDGCSFILFDIHVTTENRRGIWLERHNVKDIAGKLDCRIVPVYGCGTLSQAVSCTFNGLDSIVAPGHTAEGLVLRPKVELVNRMGRRIITKIKHKDFPREG